MGAIYTAGMTQHLALLLGAILGFTSVAQGAFGAHYLRDKLDSRHLEIFQTAVNYQMLHALLLVFLSERLARLPKSRLTQYSAWATTGGIFIFSGSLYLLVATKIKTWGAVTPLGGVLFLLAWLFLVVAAAKKK